MFRKTQCLSLSHNFRFVATSRFNAVVHKEPAVGKVVAAPAYGAAYGAPIAKLGYGLPGVAKVGYAAPAVYHAPAAAAYLH